MALSVTKDTNFGAGGGDLISAMARGMTMFFGTLAFDSSYPTNGEAITIPGLASVDFLVADPTGGYVISLDKTNQKLKVYRADNGDTVASGTPTPLVECSNTTNLSSAGLTAVPFFAVGFTR